MSYVWVLLGQCRLYLNVHLEQQVRPTQCDPQQLHYPLQLTHTQGVQYRFSVAECVEHHAPYKPLHAARGPRSCSATHNVESFPGSSC